MATKWSIMGLVRTWLANDTSVPAGEEKTSEAQADAMLLRLLSVATRVFGGVSEGAKACSRACGISLASMGGTKAGPAAHMSN